MIKPRKRIKSVSDRQKAINLEYSRVKRIWNLKPRSCVNCGRLAEKQPHHRNGTNGSLKCDTRGWIALCFSCHRWVHDNPKEAQDCGLLAKMGEWNNTKIFDTQP